MKPESYQDATDNSPHWLSLALLGTAYLFLTSLFFSIAVNSLSMGLMALLWFSAMARKRAWLVVRTPLDLYFLGFLLAQALSTAFSSDPIHSLELSKRVLLVGLVYFFASTLTTERLSKSMVAVFLSAASLVAIFGVAKLLFDDPEKTVRLGIFQFYMTTSGILTIAALLLLPFTIHPATPLKTRLFSAVGLLFVLISLWATVTRGAYLATVAGAAIVALVLNKRLLIPILLVLILVVLLSPAYVQGRVFSVFDPTHPENLTRIQMWEAGFRIFLDHPIVGVGDIDSGKLLDEYADPAMPRVWGHVHNTPLQLLVNYGLFGFLILVGLCLKMILVEYRIFRKFRAEWFRGSFALGSLAALAAFLVSGLTEWNFGDQEVITLIWTTLGITMSFREKG